MLREPDPVCIGCVTILPLLPPQLGPIGITWLMPLCSMGKALYQGALMTLISCGDTGAPNMELSMVSSKHAP